MAQDYADIEYRVGKQANRGVQKMKIRGKYRRDRIYVYGWTGNNRI